MDINAIIAMVTRDGHAKLLDFGLAKLMEPSSSEAALPADPLRTLTRDAGQTLPGLVMGTIPYMSPEQARGKGLDARSDLFSLGIVLYEMVTSELPFKGDTPLDTMHAIAYEEARPVTIVRRNLSPQVHRIVSRCLRKRPEDRYPDAEALADEFLVPVVLETRSDQVGGGDGHWRFRRFQVCRMIRHSPHPYG